MLCINIILCINIMLCVNLNYYRLSFCDVFMLLLFSQQSSGSDQREIERRLEAIRKQQGFIGETFYYLINVFLGWGGWR